MCLKEDKDESITFDVEFELNREHIYYCWRQYMNRYKIATKKTETYKWIIERTKWNHANQIQTGRRSIKIYVHDKTYAHDNAIVRIPTASYVYD